MIIPIKKIICMEYILYVILNRNDHTAVNAFLRLVGFVGPRGIVYEFGQLFFQGFKHLDIFIPRPLCIYY